MRLGARGNKYELCGHASDISDAVLLLGLSNCARSRLHLRAFLHKIF